MSNKVLAFDHIFQAAAVATANGTAMNVGGVPAVAVQITGITSATITFEGMLDGTNWVAAQVANLSSGAVATTTITNGLYLIPTAGLDQLRCRISTYATGTITVIGKGILTAASMSLADVVAVVTGTVTVSDGAQVDIAATEQTILRAVISGATSGNNTLVAGVTGKKIKVLSMCLIVSGDVDVRFESGAGTTPLTGVMSLAADGNGFMLSPAMPGYHWFETAAAALLNLELSAAVQVSGFLTYYTEA